MKDYSRADKKVQAQDADFYGFMASIVYLFKAAGSYELHTTQKALLDALEAIMGDLERLGLYGDDLFLIRKFLEQQTVSASNPDGAQKNIETSH